MLFLDELSEMPLDMQVKLLRVLESGRFMRVGSTVSQEAHVRIIATTNRQPHQAVAVGKLREDLLYRLNMFPLELLPLRERLSVVGLLAEHFLAGIGEQEGQPRRFTSAALAQLATYRWPGNVRELRNAVQRAYVLVPGQFIFHSWLPCSDDVGSAVALPGAADAVQVAAPALAPPPHSAAQSITLPIGTSIAQAERLLIVATTGHGFRPDHRGLPWAPMGSHGNGGLSTKGPAPATLRAVSAVLLGFAVAQSLGGGRRPGFRPWASALLHDDHVQPIDSSIAR